MGMKCDWMFNNWVKTWIFIVTLHIVIDNYRWILHNILIILMSTKKIRFGILPDWLPPAIWRISFVNPFEPNWQDRSCSVRGSPRSISRSKKNNNVKLRAVSYSMVSILAGTNEVRLLLPFHSEYDRLAEQHKSSNMSEQHTIWPLDSVAQKRLRNQLPHWASVVWKHHKFRSYRITCSQLGNENTEIFNTFIAFAVSRFSIEGRFTVKFQIIAHMFICLLCFFRSVLAKSM